MLLFKTHVWGIPEPCILGENDGGKYILRHSVLLCAFLKQNTIVNGNLCHVDTLQCTTGYNTNMATNLHQNSCIITTSAILSRIFIVLCTFDADWVYNFYSFALLLFLHTSVLILCHKQSCTVQLHAFV